MFLEMRRFHVQRHFGNSEGRSEEIQATKALNNVALI